MNVDSIHFQKKNLDHTMGRSMSNSILHLALPLFLLLLASLTIDVCRSQSSIDEDNAGMHI